GCNKTSVAHLGSPTADDQNSPTEAGTNYPTRTPVSSPQQICDRVRRSGPLTPQDKVSTFQTKVVPKSVCYIDSEAADEADLSGIPGGCPECNRFEFDCSGGRQEGRRNKDRYADLVPAILSGRHDGARGSRWLGEDPGRRSPAARRQGRSG